MRIFELRGVVHEVPENPLYSIAIEFMLEMERLESNYFFFYKILGQSSRYSILFIDPLFKTWSTQKNLRVFSNEECDDIPWLLLY
jgi:hypothetical protein